MNKVKTTSNKFVYLGLAVILILFLSYTVWGLIGNNALSKTNLEVSDLSISKNEITANGADYSLVEITITNLNTSSFANNVWIGLDIKEDALTDENFSYFGWYSPSPNRAFYQTDSSGKVSFKIKSNIPGDITYEIYAANPEQKAGKYQSLEKEFILSFK